MELFNTNNIETDKAYQELPDQLANRVGLVKLTRGQTPHGGPIPRLGVTPGGRKLYHWIPG